MTLENFLIKNKACSKGLEYAKNMTLYEFYHNCNHGDWIIWLFSKTNPNDSKAIVLAAAHCANACRHLLEDERSLKAIDAALNYQAYLPVQLNEIYYAARAAARADAAIWAAAARAAAADAVDAARAVAYAVAYADNVARAAAAGAAASAATRADAALAAYAADANALRDNKLIANIIKQHLPLEIWNQQSIINN